MSRSSNPHFALLSLLFVLAMSLGCDDTPEVSEDHIGKTVELTDANFKEVVLNADTDQLVMVDFWNVSCQPCLVMAPWVAELSKEYDGRLVIGKLNTLKGGEATASEYRAGTVPQLLFFKNGERLKFDQFGEEVDGLGYATKSEMKAVIDDLLAKEAGDETTIDDMNN